MNTRQLVAAAVLGATLLGAAACAEDNAEDREAPASEQGAGEDAEYED
jgi:hypothetical protein